MTALLASLFWLSTLQADESIDVTLKWAHSHPDQIAVYRDCGCFSDGCDYSFVFVFNCPITATCNIATYHDAKSGKARERLSQSSFTTDTPTRRLKLSATVPYIKPSLLANVDDSSLTRAAILQVRKHDNDGKPLNEWLRYNVNIDELLEFFRTSETYQIGGAVKQHVDG